MFTADVCAHNRDLVFATVLKIHWRSDNKFCVTVGCVNGLLALLTSSA